MEWPTQELEHAEQIGTIFGFISAGIGILSVIAVSVIVRKKELRLSSNFLLAAVVGVATMAAGFFFAFPLSNRDSPFTWFVMMFIMYGGGFGAIMLVCSVIEILRLLSKRQPPFEY